MVEPGPSGVERTRREEIRAKAHADGRTLGLCILGPNVYDRAEREQTRAAKYKR